jgi:flagellar biosynthesis component FlhA
MEDEPFGVRIGTFFVVLGIGSFILFVTSDLAGKPDFDFLFVAMLLVGIGWLFRRKKAPPPSSGRFESLRKMRSGSKNKGKEKNTKEEKK